MYIIYIYIYIYIYIVYIYIYIKKERDSQSCWGCQALVERPDGSVQVLQTYATRPLLRYFIQPLKASCTSTLRPPILVAGWIGAGPTNLCHQTPLEVQRYTLSVCTFPLHFVFTLPTQKNRICWFWLRRIVKTVWNRVDVSTGEDLIFFLLTDLLHSEQGCEQGCSGVFFRKICHFQRSLC